MLYLFSITVKEEMEAFCVNLGPIQVRMALEVPW